MFLATEQHNSLLLAGTVALPSPVPATARVSVGVQSHDDCSEPEVYLQLVQQIDQRRTIVRIVRFEDVRAFRVSDGTTPAHEAPLQSARRMASKVAALSRSLAESTALDGGPSERLLFREAILYVPETTPVLHRAELGLTAIESVEDYGIQIWACNCMDKDPAYE